MTKSVILKEFVNCPFSRGHNPIHPITCESFYAPSFGIKVKAYNPKKSQSTNHQLCRTHVSVDRGDSLHRSLCNTVDMLNSTSYSGVSCTSDVVHHCYLPEAELHVCLDGAARDPEK